MITDQLPPMKKKIRRDVLNSAFMDKNEFPDNFLRFSKFSSFFHHFGKSILWSFIEAGSSSEADNHRKLNFNMISSKLIEQND